MRGSGLYKSGPRRSMRGPDGLTDVLGSLRDTQDRLR